MSAARLILHTGLLFLTIFLPNYAFSTDLYSQFWSQPDGDETNIDSSFFSTCKKANGKQIDLINKGNSKIQDFLTKCASETGGSAWCDQLIRPNPSSLPIFQCTYGTSQVHQLINPDVKTWQYAFQAVRFVGELEKKGIKVCLIYNWWRPEPYNQNVGGAPGRHPYGTSVDVRFCSMPDMEEAFKELCKWRSQGKMSAVGYYGSTALHFGVGDAAGNTWGKDCP